MKEHREYVEAVHERVTMPCPKKRCYGKLEYDGMTMLTSNPPLYPHKCWKCGHVENLDNTYPRIETTYAPA